MTDEPKIQAAIDAALNSEPEEPAPNPKREVPMPDTFTRVEDFLNTPLFESKADARHRWRPSPGVLLNTISCLAGLATIAAALYWYSSAKNYQKLTADLAGELQIAYQQRGDEGKPTEGTEAFAELERQQLEIAAEAGSEAVPVTVEGSPVPRTRDATASSEGKE